MLTSNRFLGGTVALTAALALMACGSGGETTTTDEDTAVTDVDPGEGDGTIDDTTVIDATIGAEEAMGMESRMPADSSSTPGGPDAPAASAGSDDAPAPAAEAPAEDEPAEEDTE